MLKCLTVREKENKYQSDLISIRQLLLNEITTFKCALEQNGIRKKDKCIGKNFALC